ncbi:hypothetical protein FFWV33_10540 [Flavobacterium faecale]|uniref:Type I restriction enzyme R protein N-terminal domain-containing protein n=1 Tax=Flavobacterium faecale TaxID=1355330 RepID=A0A2S1LE25_9FLAO|nr:hypothetical protein [Flavobacterium faecale]AWG21931.1 hypothetical protein FFWV33_10540 [Flavobacterium faecale]
MSERELENLFIEFLLNRGYSRDNLLSQFAIRIDQEKTLFRPDLLIIDTVNKEYIGLIEFKNRIDERIEEITLGQFYKLFSYLGTKNIPAYLVIPIDEQDFQIFGLTKDNSFEPISKDDFPNFKTLSAKRITEEKIKQRELYKKKCAELEDKKRRNKQSSYLALLSLIVGISASLIAVFFQQKGFDKQSKQPDLCCDSLENQFKNLQDKVLVLERQLNNIAKSNNKTDTIFRNSNLSFLEKRVKIIETGISDNPEKTLSLLQVRQEIELLKKADDYSKELTQSKLDVIQKEMEVQNTWMLGVLIAIFGTILSLVIPNLLARRNGNHTNT